MASMMNEAELEEADELTKVAPVNPFGAARGAPIATNVAADTDQSRAIAETQAAMIIAKRFPRDQISAMDRILQACTRATLAETALYSYARGGTDITGPSIRMAETLAREWGNIQFGVRELEQRSSESTVEAFAWDIETNTRQVKVFQVPHLRFLSAKGGKPARTVRLQDPRDIYELVANQGARRLRACILGIIPGDVIEAAVKQCDVTLRTKVEITPERLQSLVEKFAAYGVTRESMEKKIQRRLDVITPALMVNLGKIYNSLKDGMSAASDWFEIDATTEDATEKPKTGTASLKEAAAKVAKRDADSDAPTYATVRQAIETAADVDVLDLAASLIAGQPEQFHAELQSIANVRRKTFK